MPNIVPVILAAGDSSRMGYPKALLPLGADTFLTRILRAVRTLALPQARVVLGRDAARILPLVSPREARTIINPDPGRGQVSSLRLAAQTMPPESLGCLVWPVDQPLVPAEVAGELVRCFLESSPMVALPRCNGQAGHPAILGRTLLDELIVAPADTSPKLIISRYRAQTAWVETGDKSTIEDLDTPEDYLRIVGEPLKTALARRAGEITP